MDVMIELIEIHKDHKKASFVSLVAHAFCLHDCFCLHVTRCFRVAV